MEHQARGASAQLPGHLMRPGCKHRIRGIRYCPSYLYAGKQIQYYRQISLSFAHRYIVLFLIGLLVLQSVAQQYPKNISPTCKLSVTSRNRTYLLWNATSDQNLSRHHIIPARRLINFYNTALSHSDYSNNYHEARELTTILSNLAGHTFGFYQSDTIAQISNNTMSLLRTFNNTLTYEDLLRIESSLSAIDTQRVMDHLFVWVPFNIFEGPQSRTDDPGSEFERLARPIIGEELFDELSIINNEMISYLEIASMTLFNDIVSRFKVLVSNYTWHLTIYNSSNWEKEENGKYHIKRDNRSYSLKRKREINEEYSLDPYCFEAEKFLTDHGDEIFNVVIVGKAFERATKFYSKNYDSWKDWYNSLSWYEGFLRQPGIVILGRAMARGNIFWNPHGYKFSDGSFVVGIIGDDVKYGNDNWKALKGDDWETGDTYAGQIFFDKNGRPVAIAISNKLAGNFGSGWSFIYNNGKWEYEPKDNWDTRRFAGSTLSLDPYAPRFFIDNKDYIETVKYGHNPNEL
ncbi:uncharacterized protein LOC143373705 [Andrena cerasifolii]|uniref:uncharacterized protein LOC143373705 n=1 Tax=Andrena cerasifolii TaxID=2819439 RepID=UPI0040377E47